MYKVVRYVDGRYVSFFPDSKQYKLEYKIGEPTFPNKGKLFVFETFADACEFYTFYLCPDSFIFRCECGPIERRKLIPRHEKDFDFYWDNGFRGVELLRIVPYGTVLTDWVTLIQRV